MVHKLGDQQGHVLPSAQEGTGIYVSKDGVMEAGASEETSRSAVVPIRVAQQKEAHARRKFAEALPIYSLAATATANGLNVEEYLTRLCRSETILPWV